MTLGTLTGTYKIAMDPKLEFVGQRSTPKLSLRLVANKSKKDDSEPSGWKTLATHWIDGVLWGARAEALMEQVQKGSDIRVFGEPSTEQWEKDGEKKRREVLQIIGYDVMPARNGNGGSVSQASQASRQSNDDPWGSEPQTTGSFGGGDDSPPF